MLLRQEQSVLLQVCPSREIVLQAWGREAGMGVLIAPLIQHEWQKGWRLGIQDKISSWDTASNMHFLFPINQPVLQKGSVGVWVAMKEHKIYHAVFCLPLLTDKSTLTLVLSCFMEFLVTDVTRLAV